MKQKTTPKKIIFILLMVILCAPLFQSYVHVFTEIPLKGWAPKSPDDTLSISNWLDGSYQTRKEKFLDENIPFRTDCIRFYNELDYKAFHHLNEQGIYMGKDKVLFDSSYTEEWLGKNFVGEKKLDSLIIRIKFLQDTLSKLNKTLIIGIAANKSSYLQKYLPPETDTTKSESNYDYFISKAGEIKINCIDFNKWFLNQRNKTKAPLFSKYGIHWSSYADYVVMDSLIHYIEQKRNITMPQLDYTNSWWNTRPADRDADIWEGLNLAEPIPSDSLKYASANLKERPNQQKPVMLSISDSFWWGIYNKNIPQQFFTNSHFWYYDEEVWPGSEVKRLKPSDLNLKQEIMNQEVIVLIVSEPHIKDMGWGFIEDSYKIFGGK